MDDDTVRLVKAATALESALDALLSPFGRVSFAEERRDLRVALKAMGAIPDASQQERLDHG